MNATISQANNLQLKLAIRDSRNGNLIIPRERAIRLWREIKDDPRYVFQRVSSSWTKVVCKKEVKP